MAHPALHSCRAALAANNMSWNSSAAHLCKEQSCGGFGGLEGLLALRARANSSICRVLYVTVVEVVGLHD